MSGYWFVKPGTTVTANKGADLFWVIADDTNLEKKTTSSLVGPNGYIQNEDTVTIKGSDSPAGYDIDINGNAKITPHKDQFGVPNKTTPLVVDGFNLTIKDGAVVTVEGKATGDSTIVVTKKDDNNHEAGKIILEGNATLDIKDDAQIRLENGKESIQKGENGKVEKNGSGSLIDGNRVELTPEELAALRAAQALAAQTPAADATVPATETKTPEKSAGEPDATEPEKKAEEAAAGDKTTEEKNPAGDADKTTETKDPAAETGKAEDAKESDKATDTKDTAAESDKSTETKDPVKEDDKSAETKEPAKEESKPADTKEPAKEETKQETSASTQPEAPSQGTEQPAAAPTIGE